MHEPSDRRWEQGMSSVDHRYLGACAAEARARRNANTALPERRSPSHHELSTDFMLPRLQNRRQRPTLLVHAGARLTASTTLAGRCSVRQCHQRKCMAKRISRHIPPSACKRLSRVKWGRLVAGSQRVSSGRRTAYLKDRSHRLGMQSQESSKCVVQPQPVFDRCSAAVRAARSQFIPGKAQFVARRWWKDSSS